MKILKVSPVNFVATESTLEHISSVLDKLERHGIEQISWPEFSYKPRASFAIAYSDDSILLKYFVQEKHIRIVHHESNSPVHQDSCVEFFISFNDENAYYNLEFNSIGTCLFGFGESRDLRKLIGEEHINRIRRMTMINTLPIKGENLVNWELTLVLPIDIFVNHHITHLKKKNCRVNFYKCGDGLPEPHYLSWKEILAASPDFHLPEYFGVMQFV